MDNYLTNSKAILQTQSMPINWALGEKITHREHIREERKRRKTDKGERMSERKKRKKRNEKA